MNKNLHINIEQDIKNEEEAIHQMVQNDAGQFVDAYINMNQSQSPPTGGQVETLLHFRTDSDTLRLLENIETENEVLGRIKLVRSK